MATYINVQYLFLCLVVYYHDAEVFARARAEGMFDRQIADEDNSELRWLNGISVGELGVKDRIRLIRDQISHGIEKFATLPEVEAWLDKVGGIVKLNEAITGLSMGEKGWYRKQQKKLREEEGYELPPIGAPSLVLVDSATSYSGYAIEAHRTMIVRKAHGEVDDLEEQTTPNWALSWLDKDDSLPYWWKSIHPSQLPINGSKISIFAKWRKIICHGSQLGRPPYKNLYTVFTEAQIDRNLSCQELINRFYQEPDRLWWRHVPIGGGRMTWVGGMLAKDGQWIWLSLSKKANDSFNYWTDDGRNVVNGKIRWDLPPREAGTTFDKKALVKDQMSIFTRKKGEDLLEVRVDMIDAHGRIAVLRKLDYSPKEWGAYKRKLTHRGWKEIILRKGTAPEKEMEI